MLLQYICSVYLTIFWSIYVVLCSCLPAAAAGHKERQTKLAESYDYVIIGGGTSGLVIANRLTEDITILVIEYGYLDDGEDILRPWRGSLITRDLYNVSSIPQPYLANRSIGLYAGAVVGGGSAVNGMFLDRGSALDYDYWERLGNPGWNFAGMLPYFKKSTTFNRPEDHLVNEFNLTYDIDAAYGTKGPIHISYPPWQWPGQKIQWKSWLELGIKPSREGAGGDAYGIFWIPSAQDPKTQTRSYSRTGYYDPVKNRTNLRLLTGWRVNEILLSSGENGATPVAQGVTLQPRQHTSNATILTIKAKKEVILSAGWLHTPQILQRSGIGPSSVLKNAGIKQVVDLPGVGSNLQDHAGIKSQHQYLTDIYPNPQLMSNNQTFQEWALKEWQEKRRGPYTQRVGNSAAFLPLIDIHPDAAGLAAKVNAQNASQHLPASYGPDERKGYLAQLKLLTEAYLSPKSAMLEVPFSGGDTKTLVIQKQLARGTIKLNDTDRYAEPIVDYNLLSNPVDIEIIIAMVRTVRKWYATKEMAQLTPKELTPGPSVVSDADLSQWVRNSLGGSTAHGCCTSPMMPREQGGVVGPDLKVYGVDHLTVADGSIMPMLPATHICATTYAIAEKAADIIKMRARH